MSRPVMQELVMGKGAHADVLASVDGVGPAVAGERVALFPHTIYGLVWHAAYWMDYELQRIEGQAPPYPGQAEASWPETAAPRDEVEWKATVAWFREGVLALRALAALPEAEGERKVERTHETSNQGDTLADIVWQTLVHNSYHVGQVVLLRQALGAWPPPAGRDTW
jgi:uncharacterized damage-inducible protein DinB